VSSSLAPEKFESARQDNESIAHTSCERVYGIFVVVIDFLTNNFMDIQIKTIFPPQD
jgi:hypothetical protein